jgi:predicted Fe-Mo cluster-binding NifX family protein
MKYAISATGNTPESPIDPRFGRAPWFIVIESETGEIVSTIDNRAAAEAAHGAGINAAAMMAESGVNAVVTGRVGPKAQAVLEQAGIKIIDNVKGDTVANIIASLTETGSSAQNTGGGNGPVMQDRGMCRNHGNRQGGRQGRRGGCGCGNRAGRS